MFCNAHRGVMRFYIEMYGPRFLKALCPLGLFYLLLVFFSIEDVKRTNTACFYRDDFLPKKFLVNGGNMDDVRIRDFSHTADRRTTVENKFPRKMSISFTIDCSPIKDLSSDRRGPNITKQCELTDCTFPPHALKHLSVNLD